MQSLEISKSLPMFSANRLKGTEERRSRKKNPLKYTFAIMHLFVISLGKKTLLAWNQGVLDSSIEVYEDV